jgi:Polyketide cyclase / dehydrase and lipid transport
MTKVNMSTELPVPAQTVWNVIGNFNALSQWHPAVAKSEETKQGGATLRKLTLHGGGTIVERLEKKDDSEQSYSYSILEGPLPVSGYSSRIRVGRGKTDSSCTVEWSSEFEAAGVPESEAMKVIRGMYEAGLQNLQKMYGR